MMMMMLIKDAINTPMFNIMKYKYKYRRSKYQYKYKVQSHKTS